MSRITVKTRSWDRFVTRDFAVAPDVLGRQVEFSLGISRVRVALPTERDIGNRSDVLAKVTIGSWYDERDRKIPIEFLIHNVDVVVDPDKSVEVPSDVFNRPPNAFDIISSAEQASLNTLANKCGEIAASAFDHWVRVLRWKAMNGAICRPAVQGSRSGWATHLQDENGRNFWATSVMIVVRGTRPITTDVWSHIESALHGGDTPPVYIELLFDAEYHLSLGDLRRSVIDSAVACEATMRQNIATHLPATLTKTARAQIERAN